MEKLRSGINTPDPQQNKKAQQGKGKWSVFQEKTPLATYL
jgi:hypothetical protein